MKIGIVGNGVVGNATARAFENFAEVFTYDANPLRSRCKLSEAIYCDLVFVCLPTPQKMGSLECDTSAIDEFFCWCSDHDYRSTNFVLKSTVPIGYTRKARERYGLPNLVHSPEFLTARTAVEDAANPTRLVVGDPAFAVGIDGPLLGSCGKLLKELYNSRFRYEIPSVDVEGEIPVDLMSSDESEAVKLFQNAFSAIKIVSFNEFRCLADALKLDWGRVREALLAGGWINPMHTQVPGPDGKRGFGGACLPKDLANLISCIQAAGLGGAPLITLAAHDRNESHDRKEPQA